MKVKVVCLMVVFLAQTVHPCIWIKGTKYNGESINVSGHSAAVRLRRFENFDTRQKGLEMEAELRTATDFDKRSDYSVALMYLGRAKEAVDLLRALENEEPGQYFIAANLGTAFELSGDNEAALHWIKEGIQRNADAHFGTEWLHVKILEAKIAQQRDVDYFKKHSVLDLAPENLGGRVNIGNRTLSSKELSEAIEYQLSERLQFVKPPDPAVASLLFDYAAIEAVSRSMESAKGVLNLAVEYGYPSDKVQPMIKVFDRRISWRRTKQYALYVLYTLAAAGVLAYLYERKIFVISRSDLKGK